MCAHLFMICNKFVEVIKFVRIDDKIKTGKELATTFADTLCNDSLRRSRKYFNKCKKMTLLNETKTS